MMMFSLYSFLFVKSVTLLVSSQFELGFSKTLSQFIHWYITVNTPISQNSSSEKHWSSQHVLLGMFFDTRCHTIKDVQEWFEEHGKELKVPLWPSNSIKSQFLFQEQQKNLQEFFSCLIYTWLALSREGRWLRFVGIVVLAICQVELIKTGRNYIHMTLNIIKRRTEMGIYCEESEGSDSSHFALLVSSGSLRSALTVHG